MRPASPRDGLMASGTYRMEDLINSIEAMMRFDIPS